MSLLRLMLQTSIAGHHTSRGQTLDREDGFQLQAVSVQQMMPLSLEEFTTWLQIHMLKLERGVHNVAIDIYAETRKVEGKLDALVNLVTQLAVNQKSTCVARVCGIRSSNDHHTNVFHNVAIDIYAETRKVEGKLDALVNLVTQLAVNQESACVARVCAIRSSHDNHTNRRWLPTPSSFGARNDAIVIRGVHDVATDTSAETRKVEGKLDALVNLVSQLAMNQKPASVARVCHHSSRGQSLDREDGFQLLAVSVLEMMPFFGARNDAIVNRGVHDVATDTSAETRKVEGKLDALVNMVTQLAVNQKPDLCYKRVHDVATDTSAETRKVEGKLDAFVNLVTQLAVNQKPASVARAIIVAEARHLIGKMASSS
ncbi:hypothetical protein Fmac_024874 [Flemingia macrophylla]|uniref:Uncharacterized protein n=1 Tax=Flemingia macrophylla TaxID=520843 RepID=A0ABD1LQM3_9FABA